MLQTKQLSNYSYRDLDISYIVYGGFQLGKVHGMRKVLLCPVLQTKFDVPSFHCKEGNNYHWKLNNEMFTSFFSLCTSLSNHVTSSYQNYSVETQK